MQVEDFFEQVNDKNIISSYNSGFEKKQPNL